MKDKLEAIIERYNAIEKQMTDLKKKKSFVEPR